MNRRTAMLPTCTSSGTWSTRWPSRAARSSAVLYGGVWKRKVAPARSSSPASRSRSWAIVPNRISASATGTERIPSSGDTHPGSTKRDTS
jgi:hypothetical protein